MLLLAIITVDLAEGQGKPGHDSSVVFIPVTHRSIA